jgi:molecular chaperone DnaK
LGGRRTGKPGQPQSDDQQETGKYKGARQHSPGEQLPEHFPGPPDPGLSWARLELAVTRRPAVQPRATNACVAHVRNKLPKVVPTDRGNLILPTVVALSEKGDFLVGGVAKDQLVVNPKNTIYGAKRLIGRKWNSKVVQELRNYYSYDIVEGPGGEAAVLLGGQVRTLPEISAMVLAHVKKIAEAFLQKGIDEAIISVPAYYSDAQRLAVRQAGALAGFEVKRIVNEPTAAALAYGFSRGLDQKVLVYDLGGGTFDV